ASHHFTYEFDQHSPDIRKYIHLYTGVPGETEIAVYCPTTLYPLGADLKTTIDSSRQLRDLCDFDVLDELLIDDGALNEKYKMLVMFQADIVEQKILDKITNWMQQGRTLVLLGKPDNKHIEGDTMSRLLSAHT